MSASLAVQRLLVAALAAVPGLTGIHDGVAPDAPAPYLTLGAGSVTDWSTKTGIGHEHRVQLSIWDDLPGTARVKTLAALAETAVLAIAGSRDGHRIAGAVLIRMVFAKIPDGWTEASLDFRIRTQQL